MRIAIVIIVAVAVTAMGGGFVSAQETSVGNVVIEPSSPTTAILTYAPVSAQPLLEVYKGDENACPSDSNNPVHRELIQNGRTLISGLEPGETYTAWTHVLESGQTRAYEGGISRKVKWTQLWARTAL